MKQSQRFKFKDIANLARKELLQAGISTSTVYHTGEGYYFIDYFPVNTEQEKVVIKIKICMKWLK